MLDELQLMRSRSAELAKEVEQLKEDVVSLRSDLERKDQELKSIKQVLLQKKP